MVSSEYFDKLLFRYVIKPQRHALAERCGLI